MIEAITLTNPTDDQLDEAVAEHVAGWTRVALGGTDFVWKHPRPSDGELSIYPLAKFSRDIQAVMPLLQKCSAWNMVGNPGMAQVTLALDKIGNVLGQARAKTPARAITIALLRANGVTVTINENSTPDSPSTKTNSHA